jgi:peptidoglycan/LPS O-acetylase OafA/YrhL
MNGTASPSERIPGLDGVRGLAILLVVAMHALFFGVPLPGASAALHDSLYVRLAGLGWCGVDVFFVLSGFLITGILVRSKGAPHYFRNFYVRRALRIFPLYYLVLVLLLWVLPRPATTAAERWSYLLYYQNFRFAFGGDVTSDVARDITWSLAVEEQFYLVWPAIVWWLSTRRLVAMCIGAIVLAMVFRFVGLEAGIPRPYFLTFCRIDALAAGALLAILPKPSAVIGYACVLAGGAGLALIVSTTGNSLPHVPVMQTQGLIAALVFAVGVLIAARGPGPIGSMCRWLPLRSLGAYSYCIYLVHFLVIEELAKACYGPLGDAPRPWQQWLVATFPAPFLLLLFASGCLFVSWAVGFVSWHVFERWFVAAKRFFPAAPPT